MANKPAVAKPQSTSATPDKTRQKTTQKPNAKTVDATAHSQRVTKPSSVKPTKASSQAATTSAAKLPQKTASSSDVVASTLAQQAASTKSTMAVVQKTADKVRPEKLKMVRDSFTVPKDEYAQIASLKKHLDALGQPAKKSELLRAGLRLLSTLNDAQLLESMRAIPVIKTGRPKNKH